MIPKKIHYCWFGGSPLPELTQRCISSWRKYCPDYEIIEWNEDNFDISCNDYIKEAYEAKKWAFVTDYVRLKVIYENGGIYFDTDVEVIRPIDSLLYGVDAFFAMESPGVIATGLGFGAKKGNSIVKALMDDYNDIHFLLEDGSYDLTSCPKRNEDVFASLGFVHTDELQKIGNAVFYPHDYFCPKSWETGEIEITDNTVCIHHFNASWFTEKDKKNLEEFRSRERRRLRLHEQYGEEKGEKKYRRWERLRRKYYYLRTHGLLHTIKIIIYKLLGKI